MMTNAENLVVWQWHSHVNFTEILIRCVWLFLKDLVDGGHLMSNYGFLLK